MKSFNDAGQVALEWMGLQQVQQYASISERTVREWIHRPMNPLPAVRVGTKILIKRSELDAWLMAHSLRAPNVDVEAVVTGIISEFRAGD